MAQTAAPAPATSAPATPTKAPGDENFPVASLILAPAHRAKVLAFYRFVREADDIADSGTIAPEEKIARLDRMEAALLAGDAAVPSAVPLHAQGIGSDQARILLDAFRQDAVKTRYADWAELLDYCRRSADPVGRFLLRLHGEGPEADAPSDALCTALQILNHLQDLGKDRDALDRIYLPVPWMEPAGGEAAFFAPSNAAARRAVLDAALDQVDVIIDTARGLPGRVRDRRLRAQCIATIGLADALSRRLRRDDPLLMRVEVSKGDVAKAGLGGFLGTFRSEASRDAAITSDIVRRSSSSFRLGMQSLSADRKRAIHAVYAFCRVADDIADGRAPLFEKRRLIDQWRAEIDRLPGAPTTPIGRELAYAATAFDVPLTECHAMLDGMETDSAERVRIADDAGLDLYVRRVAGSVGLMSIPIFGAPEARDFAVGLGRTLQIVNILRDVDEDAAIERVYVPLARLQAAGIEDGPARMIVADPRFAAVCRDLAEEASAGFAAADAALAHLNRAALKPAILMKEGYRRIFLRLMERGWATRGERQRLTAGDRLHMISLALRPA
ncbi:MAG TPA: squalene/phytoene synthase family protein [Microvirga sp.]|jgi:phytoene synthase|nr:squalene/phytoene synthase family protein [Microvirga sp.]